VRQPEHIAATGRGSKAIPEVAQHYSHHLIVPVTDADAKAGFVRYRIDPYRIAATYNVGGGPREHILKKCLRGTDKGQPPIQVVHEIRAALDRWEQLIHEDDATSAGGSHE